MSSATETTVRARERGARRPRILLIAYACTPGEGSEPGAGWALARMLAATADVCVLTRENNAEAIEQVLRETPERDHMRIVYVDLPRRLRFWKRGQRGVRLYYLLWLLTALRRSRALGSSVGFDLVWHVTLSNCWIGSTAPRLGLPFVYGPIGGGMGVPLRLVPELGARGALYELIRATARGAGRYVNPLARSSWRRADLILCQNEETRAWLPARHQGRAHVFPHIALEEAAPEPAATDMRDNVALYAGRLLAWKGVSLAIAAIAAAPGWQLVVCGEGSEEKRLRRLVARLGVDDRVRFVGSLRRREVLGLMENETRVLIHPSMHEDAGWVIAEARARGLTVVCLDRGGPPLIAGEGGRAVPVGSRRSVVDGLAAALRLAEDEPRRADHRWQLESREAELARLLAETLGIAEVSRS